MNTEAADPRQAPSQYTTMNSKKVCPSQPILRDVARAGLKYPPDILKARKKLDRIYLYHICVFKLKTILFKLIRKVCPTC